MIEWKRLPPIYPGIYPGPESRNYEVIRLFWSFSCIYILNYVDNDLTVTSKSTDLHKIDWTTDFFHSEISLWEWIYLFWFFWYLWLPVYVVRFFPKPIIFSLKRDRFNSCSVSWAICSRWIFNFRMGNKDWVNQIGRQFFYCQSVILLPLGNSTAIFHISTAWFLF